SCGTLAGNQRQRGRRKAVGGDDLIDERPVGASNVGQRVDRVVDTALQLGQVVVQLRTRKRVLLLLLLEAGVAVVDFGFDGIGHSVGQNNRQNGQTQTAPQGCCGAVRGDDQSPG